MVGRVIEKNWLIGRDTNIAHFRLWIHGRSLGHSTPWMRGRCMPSRPRSRLIVGFSFAFGWCSGGTGLRDVFTTCLWRVERDSRDGCGGERRNSSKVFYRHPSLPLRRTCQIAFKPPLAIASFAAPTISTTAMIFPTQHLIITVVRTIRPSLISL